MRVAVVQFASSSNTHQNLENCIRMINEAAACKPSFIVLPEYCNTLFFNAKPCYVDHNQAWHEAITATGAFIQAVGQQAKQHNCYIVLNVTMRRDACRDHQYVGIKSNISVTSCLFSPLGELIQQVDKQTLVDSEKQYFNCASNMPEVVNTTMANVGLISGSDITPFTCAQGLALSGAQLLCHSVSTFAQDESDIHAPARACENRVFVALANKVGELMPAEQSMLYAQQTSIPQACLVGLGQSQIIAPNGKVLAKLSHHEEGVIFADINIDEANDKCRPDGTDIVKQRRPELYQRQTLVVNQDELPEYDNVAKTANVAIFATYTANEQAIEDVCHYIENNLSDIIQLPELFFVADKTTINDAKELRQIEILSKQLIDRVATQLRPFQYICTSLVLDNIHQAVIISDKGIFATQVQLHFCQRYQWTELADEVNVITLPLEQGTIKLTMLTADDANIADVVNVAALKGIHLLLVPFDIQEASEVTYNLLSSATEHRICIVAATREKNFSRVLASDTATSSTGNKQKIKCQKATGLIINLTTEASLLPQWQARSFNGYINPALVKHQHGKITKAVIHPIAASNKNFQY